MTYEGYARCFECIILYRMSIKICYLKKKKKILLFLSTSQVMKIENMFDDFIK